MSRVDFRGHEKLGITKKCVRVGDFDRRVLYGDRLLDRQTCEQTLDGQELDKLLSTTL